MKKIYLLLSFLFSFLSYAQDGPAHAVVDAKMAAIPAVSANSIDAVATYINLNFKTDTDKIRAAFYWTASNISYDVANMNAVNFQESTQEKIARTLKTKRGVCIHYAVVLNALSEKIGIQSYIIDGYNKQNGNVGNLAHAWTAAKIDKKWYIFDPTWASGYVNNGKFYKKLNNLYFKAEPATIIASHIPFDYIWQFLNYPITNEEFYEGKIQINKNKKYFDFEKEITKYKAMSEVDQLYAAAERIEKNGLKNAMIQKRYEGKKRQLLHLRKNTNIEKLNIIVNEMNEAVVLLNDFIHYRNNKFSPVFSDEEISNMIEIPVDRLAKCQNEIYSVGSVGTENTAKVSSIKKSLRKALAQAEEHSLFVQHYLSKSKMGRTTMFSGVIWL